MPRPADRAAGRCERVHTLVLGGIRSGKSHWAERTVAKTARRGPVRYIATGRGDGGDESWAQRVAEHRRRRPTHWTTVETGDLAAELRSPAPAATLVDDVGGWLTGVLDSGGWNGASPGAQIDDLLAAVEAFPAPLLLVSPEVGLTVVPATAAGRLFADELGRLNQRLADLCDQVVLVVAGQPVWVKDRGAGARPGPTGRLTPGHGGSARR